LARETVRLDPGRVAAWQPRELTVDPWTVLRLARYRQREDAPAAVWSAARAMAARATALAVAEGRLRLVEIVAAAERGVTLAGGPSFSGTAVTRHVSGASRAVLFALTVGPALETEVAALSASDEPLDAYLLDLAGWAALEASVRALRRDVIAALPGARVSHRLGPGHLDWPIEEQAVLIPLLAGESPLVRLSEQGVLLPFKSISGLFALREPSG
jgi:hypothetical protein